MTASRSATQSPTAGSSAPEDASWRRRPARWARSSPASVSTSYSPRCWAETRPAMQLSCGSSAAAKPSSQPRSCKFKRSSFQEWVESGRVPETSRSSLQRCAAASREPQALRPEGAVDVMSHLLCRKQRTRQSLAAAPHGRLTRTGQGFRIDHVDPRRATAPATVRPDPCLARGRPPERASRRSFPPVALAGRHPNATSGRRDEHDRCAVAGVCPLGEERLAVGRQREAVPLRRGLDRRQRESHDLPARWRPPLDGRLRRRGQVPADPKAGNARRSARPARLLGGRRGLFGRAATGDDERERDAGEPAHEPSIGHARDTGVTVTGACSARCSTTASSSARLRTGRRARPRAGARRPS